MPFPLAFFDLFYIKAQFASKIEKLFVIATG